MRMKRARVRYTEGDVFSVPLEQGGFVACVVARRHGPIFLGYFFGPRAREMQDSTSLALAPQDLLLKVNCGDLDIIEGRWPKMGAVKPWVRAEWPIPMFRSCAVVRGQIVAVTYTDGNLTDPIVVDGVTVAEVESLPTDKLYGAGSVVSYLSSLVGMAEQV